MKNQENEPSRPEHRLRRRRLLNWLWSLLAAAACFEIGWLTLSIFSSRRRLKTLQQQETIIDAGASDQFVPGEVVAIAHGGFYLCCLEDRSFLALSRTCTHLGCAIPWNPERQVFSCPCHGSSFDRRGLVMTPPALRPLDYYPVRIENGRIKVDISQSLRRQEFSESQAVRI